MTSESLQRGTRAKKEAFILSVVRAAGKIKATELFGVFSKRYQGSAVRTFLNEYLVAMEYRGEVVLSVNAEGYYVYAPVAFDEEIRKQSQEKIANDA